MNTNKKVYLLLIAIIVILVGIIAYAFAIQPIIDRNLAEAQGQGVGLTINAIVQQIQERGYASIPVGEEQTLILVPANIQGSGTTGENTETENLDTEVSS